MQEKLSLGILKLINENNTLYFDLMKYINELNYLLFCKPIKNYFSDKGKNIIYYENKIIDIESKIFNNIIQYIENMYKINNKLYSRIYKLQTNDDDQPNIYGLKNIYVNDNNQIFNSYKGLLQTRLNHNKVELENFILKNNIGAKPIIDRKVRNKNEHEDVQYEIKTINPNDPKILETNVNHNGALYDIYDHNFQKNFTNLPNIQILKNGSLALDNAIEKITNYQEHFNNSLRHYESKLFNNLISDEMINKFVGFDLDNINNEIKIMMQIESNKTSEDNGFDIFSYKYYFRNYRKKFVLIGSESVLYELTVFFNPYGLFKNQNIIISNEKCDFFDHYNRIYERPQTDYSYDNKIKLKKLKQNLASNIKKYYELYSNGNKIGLYKSYFDDLEIIGYQKDVSFGLSQIFRKDNKCIGDFFFDKDSIIEISQYLKSKIDQSSHNIIDQFINQL